MLYVHYPRFAHVYLIAAYGKNEQDDITEAERKQFAGLIRRLEAGLEEQFGSAVDRVGGD